MKQVRYFNTAAIGQPATKTRDVVAAFERIRGRIGQASERSRKLIELGEVSEDDSDAALVSAYWRGINSLAYSICKLVGLEDHSVDVVLTTGTSRAIELALSSLTLQDDLSLVTTDLEHGSEFKVIDIVWRGEKKIVALKKALLAGVSESELVDRIVSEIKPGTVLLLSHVISACGTVLPIKLISQAAKERHKDVVIVVDGAHGPGNVNVNISDTEIDLYLGSGHKWLRGPETSGFLLITDRASQRIREIIEGRLLTAYSWIQGNSERASRAGGSFCCCELGTKYISPLVGLMVSVVELFGAELAPISRAKELRLEFERRVKETLDLGLLNDQIALENSAICGIALDSSETKSRRTSAYDVVRRLEHEFDIVCEATSNEWLRFSFSGNESNEDLSAAVDGLRNVLQTSAL